MTVARLFLCGDVMTGRGIDQILPRPCDPLLHETYAQSALDYVWLAEERNGPIARPAAPDYIWGEALDEWRAAKPDARIVNLETSITRSEEFLDKGINYRMSPENADCLSAAGIDCCVLANNQVLDWGQAGLRDTLAVLRRLGIKSAGAGRDRGEAVAPAVLPLAGKGRVLVFSFALASSGTLRGWAAGQGRAGVNFLDNLSAASAARVCEQVVQARQAGDIAVVSLHWGPNWGYEIEPEQRRFAHTLIDGAGVSVVYGHSSHHAKAIEVYRGRLILYGCGDFLNDYEGIEGYEEYRGDLAVMYFADIEVGSGALAAVEVVPLQIRGFGLVRPAAADVDWLRRRLDRESRPFATAVVAAPAPGRLRLAWPADA